MPDDTPPNEQQPSTPNPPPDGKTSQSGENTNDDELDKLIARLDKLDALTGKLDALNERLDKLESSGASPTAIKRTEQQIQQTEREIKQTTPTTPPKPDSKPAEQHRYWRKFGG